MATFTSPEFPNSFHEPFEVTSPSSGKYNCIAWALNDQTRFIWPLRKRGFYCPKGLPMVETIEAFSKLFAKHGYQVCENGNLEDGYQNWPCLPKTVFRPMLPGNLPMDCGQAK
ncbi:MAG: hypothetical protein IPN76_20040 [Saprospiraceae bacterium]|nr:hypothetical protein [Saprospiraceae bacterium]